MKNFAGIMTLVGTVGCPSLFAQPVDPCYTVQPTEINKVLMTSTLSNPLQMAVAPDNRIFVVEKVSGMVKIHTPGAGTTTAATLSVYGAAPHTGLLGIALDPAFSTNHFVYVYYAHATIAKHVLERYTEQNGTLVVSSRVTVLEVPGVRWTDQHHSSGCLGFGPDGNLYIATGENIDPKQSQGYASVNDALRLEDTQATSANTNDLNGKILRIRPLANGTYSIPAGNLFAATATTRGEIYVMGLRNPFRFAFDTRTGALFWGEPGPDATTASATRGPAGRDELNRATGPGFFGWPYFIAENLPYIQGGVAANPTNPVNNSALNTGNNILPPAQGSLLSYLSTGNTQYPSLGNSASRAAIMGGVYRYSPNQTSRYRLPPRFEGSVFLMDWARNFINEVRLDSNTGAVSSVARFLGNLTVNGPINMAFGPNGDMYLLEYTSNSLFHIQYQGTCPMTPTAISQARQGNAHRLESRWQWIPKNTLRIPEGMKSLTGYDLRGNKVWEVNEYGLRPDNEYVKVPAGLEGKFLLLKWEFGSR